MTRQKDKKRILYTLIWIGGMSLCLVFLFWFLIQWDYLRAGKLVVAGAERLSDEAVLDKSGLRKGMNILAVNLSLARKRLLSHPWIAEAHVGVGFPPEIRIRIREHRPLAVFELDRKFLVNADGKIFKEWNPLDAPRLPVVTGLRFADVEITGKSKGPILEFFQASGAYLTDLFQKISDAWNRSFGAKTLGTDVPPGPEEESDAETMPFKAVMNVLQFGLGPNSVLPNRWIQEIRVDREMGIELVILPQNEGLPENEGLRVDRIRLGFHNYPVKYDHLRQLLHHLNNEEGQPEIHSIDLNNLDRMVVSPTNADSLAREYKEDV